MSNSRIRQLQHESDTWKRSLWFMSEENVHLKNRLSEILKGGTDKDMLETAEAFQSRFINKDDMIRFLRGDIAAFDKLVLWEAAEDGLDLNQVMKKAMMIRDHMNKAEEQFRKLKLDFNRYFLDYVSTN